MRTAQPGLCRFALSADVGALLRCRADRILPQALEEELVGDEPLDIEVDLVLDGKVFCTGQSSKAVFDTPERGKFKPQQFIFAIKVRDLPLESQLHFRWRDASTMLRSGVLTLFNDRGVLRQGQRLVALMSQESLSACGATESCMDSNQAAVAWVQATGAPGAGHAARELEEALRLAELLSLKDRGWIPSTLESEETFSGTVQTALESSGLPWLSLQLPELPHSVVFAESSYGQDLELPVGVLSAPRSQDIDQKDLDALKGVSWLLKPIPSVATSLGSGAPIQGRSFKCFVDEGASLEHPAVLKRKRLGRGQSRAVVKDRDARPSADELRRLAELVRRPRRHLSPEEKDLLFRFRWSLTDQPGALTKFLHAVNWVDMEERSQAIELLGHWSPVEIEDALELLSKDFQGLREVRRHAVQRLESASDMDLQLYLLQLVQALRYEHDSEAETGSEALAGFLIRRAVRCTSLATLLYWYVAAEIDEGESGGLFDMVRRKLLEALTEQDQHLLQQQVLLRKKLLWCLRHAKAAGGVAVTMAAIAKRDWTDKKIERFRHALVDQKQSGEDTGGNLDLVNGLKEGIPLPVDPSLLLVGILPEECTLLKSAMNPGVLACQVRHANKSGTISIKKVMVKEGDDLRQDQLVLQLIILMDSILKRYGLDLQLTPYQVIALSRNDGMVDFVPDSANLSKVLKEHSNDIQQFFRSHHPAVGAEKDEPWGPQNSYGIKAEVLENFVRSSAGYCVITYILGIGDRHLDNLMVTKDGRLFHIDFGFILGKDPKPFPPPMRICKEMVEGMGGNSSPGYLSFKSKCCQAFKILRRHSKLIINLLYLMTDSGIKDICSDPQFAILKVEQKFQALMDDEEAEEHFLNLIDESVSALMPMIMEIGHKISVDDLRKAVLQIAATGGGWPVQLQKRLLQLLQTPCEARSCLFAAAPLSPEVDEGFTSPRALSGGWLHQAFLTMGSITGIPSFRARAELYRSQPPSVILSNASITQMRDCFAFRGSKEHPPALALRLRSPSVVTQLIIEQPPRWAALRPDSLPRRFRVYGATEATSQAYTENLGDFVYAAAGPAVQAFHLANASGARLTGLRMVFEGPESDKHYICLYRLKLFEGPETACSNGRAAWRLQTNSD